MIVGEITDHPMTDDSGGDSSTHAPKNIAPTAPRKEQERPRQMLRHPGSLKETIESIERDPWLDVNYWWVIQYQIAVELPPRISPPRGPVTQVVVALGQALCEISQLMLAKQPNGTGQAHLDTAVHQDVLQPLGTLIAVMNELSMAAERMAQQQNHSRRHEEQQKCRERKR
jgi:hypothetical protein